MGRYFDTSSAVATVATVATNPSKSADLSQKSQKSQGEGGTKFDCDNVIDLPNLFEERASILEFDGGFTRDEAERMAVAESGFDPDAV